MGAGTSCIPRIYKGFRRNHGVLTAVFRIMAIRVSMVPHDSRGGVSVVERGTWMRSGVARHIAAMTIEI